jgi:hypothetical protein
VFNPGDEVGFDYVRRNVGAAALNFPLPSLFDIATFLSTDAILDASDVELTDGYRALSVPIYAGWSGTVSESVQLPEDLEPGSYRLIVKIDAFPGETYPGVVESDEENNWLASEELTVVPPIG